MFQSNTFSKSSEMWKEWWAMTRGLWACRVNPAWKICQRGFQYRVWPPGGNKRYIIQPGETFLVRCYLSSFTFMVICELSVCNLRCHLDHWQSIWHVSLCSSSRDKQKKKKIISTYCILLSELRHIFWHFNELKMSHMNQSKCEKH